MRKIASILIGFLLVGCASSHPIPEIELVREVRTDRDTFLVCYSGKKEETVRQEALQRSAEIALQNGFRYFSVVDMASPVPNFQRHRPYDNRNHSAIELTIKCYKSFVPNAYDVEAFLGQTGNSY